MSLVKSMMTQWVSVSRAWTMPVLLVWAVVTAGSNAVGQTSRRSSLDADFGPVPGDRAQGNLARSSAPGMFAPNSLGSGRTVQPVNGERNQWGQGARDPSSGDRLPRMNRELPQSRFEDVGFEEEPATRVIPVRNRVPAGMSDELESPRPMGRLGDRYRDQPSLDDLLPVRGPVNSWEREEFDQPRRELPGRTVPSRKPVVPVNEGSENIRPVLPGPSVAPKKAEPTLAEKIAKRYADPRVIRIVEQLTPQAGESLYVEVTQLIDSRHVTPTTYDQRVQKSLEHVVIALQTPAFQQATRMQASAATIRSAQAQLRSYAGQVQVQNLTQALGVMREVGQMVSQAVQINPAAVSLEFVYGALDTLDQYSMLIAPEKSGDANLGLKENMVGIGVEVEPHPQGLKILKALAGGPAAEATLTRGDIITAVDGRPLAGLELNQAVDLIAGPSGTALKLDLARGNLVGDVTLQRRAFKVQSVAEAKMVDSNIGYIKLDQFAEATMREIDAALWKLHQDGMEALVLDLRGNPGGLLTTAIELSDRFLPGGTIVQTRGRTAADNSQEVAQYANTWKVPLVVVIDHNSASASEIFAAAIQENGRGVVVGETSYGKGTVQTLFPLKSVPSALRLTTAKFFSPEGREMAGHGVTPDVAVRNAGRNETGIDAALQAAVDAARDPKLQNMAAQPARKSIGQTGAAW